MQPRIGGAQSRQDSERRTFSEACGELREIRRGDLGSLRKGLALVRRQRFMKGLEVHSPDVSAGLTEAASDIFAHGYLEIAAPRHRSLMRTIHEIRHSNLLFLLEECGSGRGAAAKLSAATGVKAPIISQLRNLKLHTSGAPRLMGDDIARQLERGMGKDSGWMDQDRGAARNATEALLIDLSRMLTADQVQSIINVAEQLAESNGRAGRVHQPRLPGPNKRLN